MSTSQAITKRYRDKRSLLKLIMPAAKYFNEYLIGRNTKIICENNETYRINWEKQNFMHLCGLRYQKPSGHHHIVQAEVFYDDLLSHKLSIKNIGFTHTNTGILKSKCQVILPALQLDSRTNLLTIKAPANKANVTLYIGNTGFALGLLEKLINDGEYIPSSLRKQDVNSPNLRLSETSPIRVLKTIIE